MRRENREAFGIGSFDGQQRAVIQFFRHQQDADPAGDRVDMFDHLRAIHAAQRLIGQPVEILEQFGSLRLQAFGAADRDALLALIDAARGEAGFARGFEKFAASAARSRVRGAEPGELAT